MSDEKRKIIETLKQQGKEKTIQQELKKIKPRKCPKEMAYVEGKTFEDYIYDMNLTQIYAVKNRELLVNELVKKFKLTPVDSFSTIHNYIDVENLILRKGSISAQNGEKLIIPINMRDGSIIGIGKGNEDWNCSGPHGAGRILSRSKAKELLNMNEYKETMKDVFTTSVREETLDEAPMAYKSIDDILNNISDSIDVIDIIKPIYNYKC